MEYDTKFLIVERHTWNHQPDHFNIEKVAKTEERATEIKQALELLSENDTERSFIIVKIEVPKKVFKKVEDIF